MAFLEIRNVVIKGISACIPKDKELIKDIYKWDEVDTFIKITGITQRRKSPYSVTSSDLCSVAAEKLIKELDWNPKEIDCLVFVSQTQDYILPSTSSVIHGKLGLSKECYTLDISLGCSGWVYALSVIASLMQNGTMKKGLLLAGDTITKLCSPEDKSTFPLFGDAGTATALEFDDKNESNFKFIFNADGKGFETIIVEEGGQRNPFDFESLKDIEIGKDKIRKPINLALDGAQVFAFGITKVPKQIKALAAHYNINLDSIDLFVFHQANMMMNEMIHKKLNLSKEKVPYSLCEFANTSCASIPLTLVSQCKETLKNNNLKCITSGFGVGLSWASVCLDLNKIIIPSICEI